MINAITMRKSTNAQKFSWEKILNTKDTKCTKGEEKDFAFDWSYFVTVVAFVLKKIYRVPHTSQSPPSCVT